MLEATGYKDIVLVCTRKLTNVGKIFIVKLYSRNKILYVICVQKIFLQIKKKANHHIQ